MSRLLELLRQAGPRLDELRIFDFADDFRVVVPGDNSARAEFKQNATKVPGLYFLLRVLSGANDPVIPRDSMDRFIDAILKDELPEPGELLERYKIQLYSGMSSNNLYQRCHYHFVSAARARLDQVYTNPSETTIHYIALPGISEALVLLAEKALILWMCNHSEYCDQTRYHILNTKDVVMQNSGQLLLF